MLVVIDHGITLEILYLLGQISVNIKKISLINIFNFVLF